MSRMLVSAVILAVIYLLVLGSTKPGDIATGLVLGLIIAWALRGLALPSEGASPPLGRRLLALPPLAVALLHDIVTGTWQVALVSLGFRSAEHAGFVEIPLEDRTRRGAMLWGLMSNLSPGEIVVEIDEAKRVALLHVLDASNPEEIRRRHHERRKLERKVAP